MTARNSSPSRESASFGVAARASAIARIIRETLRIGWGERIRTSDWLIQNLYPAYRRFTNSRRREGPPRVAETASLPELTLEDRVACALARRGPMTIDEFILRTDSPVGSRYGTGWIEDEDFVTALEQHAERLEAMPW